MRVDDSISATGAARVGPAGEVFNEELLRKTYGGHLTVLSRAGEAIRQSKSGKK
mgnify:CR=1 FL=1